jgi:hypothetical protein
MLHLLSFADSRIKRSLQRLSFQAASLDFFDMIHLLDETDLAPEYKERFRDRLIYGSRGFGYWSWKPQVIAQTLENLGNGDLLLYLDVGCHLNKKGLGRLKEYFEILDRSESGVLAFQAKPPTADISPLQYDGRKLLDQPNYECCKGDLLDHFGIRGNPSYTHAQAIGAGVILIKKCKRSVALIREWQDIISQDFSLLDDTPSKSPNLDGFKEHRHDQAIFTFLCLKYGVLTLSAYEYWYPKDLASGRQVPDWNALKDLPIHARRDKDLGPTRNLRHNLESFFKGAISFVSG